jgi:hypothetical protein
MNNGATDFERFGSVVERLRSRNPEAAYSELRRWCRMTVVALCVDGNFVAPADVLEQVVTESIDDAWSTLRSPEIPPEAAESELDRATRRHIRDLQRGDFAARARGERRTFRDQSRASREKRVKNLDRLFDGRF